MQIKYRFNGYGPLWGTYGVQVLKLDNDVRVVLSDLPENLGASLNHCFEQVATDVVRLLMDEGHVENPTKVHWIAHFAEVEGGPPEQWHNIPLLWHVDSYVRGMGPIHIVQKRRET